MGIKLAAAVVALAALGFFLLIITCAVVLIYRRFFASRTKGVSDVGSGAEREAGGGSAAQCKALNDVIAWVFGYPAGLRWVDDWSGAWTRALTQEAARHEVNKIICLMNYY